MHIYTLIDTHTYMGSQGRILAYTHAHTCTHNTYIYTKTHIHTHIHGHTLTSNHTYK